jgi:hypothetical protein
MNDAENRQKTKKKRSKKEIFLFLLFLLLLCLWLFLDRFFGVGTLVREGISERLRDRNGAEIIEIEKKGTEKGVTELEEGVSELEEAEESEDVDLEEEEVIDEILEEEVELDITITTSETKRKEDEMDGYQVHQIAFGSSMVVGDDEIEGVELEIGSVDNEVVESLDGEGVNAIITWTTSKNAICDLNYSKKDGSGGFVMNENKYGISHAMFAQDFEEGESYVFNIKCKSKNGQEKETGFVEFEAEVEGEPFFESVGNVFRSLFGF